MLILRIHAVSFLDTKGKTAERLTDPIIVWLW